MSSGPGPLPAVVTEPSPGLTVLRFRGARERPQRSHCAALFSLSVLGSKPRLCWLHFPCELVSFVDMPSSAGPHSAIIAAGVFWLTGVVPPLLLKGFFFSLVVA